MKVGFIGLGRMGQGMAGRLLAAGHDLLITDPMPEQLTALVNAGAVAAESPAAASQGRDVIISMLPSDKVLDIVLHGDGGLIANMPATCIHMASGTHGVAAINKANEDHAKAGQTFMACPVLGRPDLAAEGLLKLVPAGPSSAVNRVRELLDVIGQQTFEAGTSPQAAAAVKIANNFMLGCAIENMGEALSLVEKLGVEPELFLQVMTQGLFAAPAYEIYGRFIVDKSWDSHGATAVIGLKDANLALEAANTVDVPLPSLQAWRTYLQSAVDAGDGHLDWAVMAKEQAQASGLDT